MTRHAMMSLSMSMFVNISNVIIEPTHQSLSDGSWVERGAKRSSTWKLPAKGLSIQE